jgi:hypothetical protein
MSDDRLLVLVISEPGSRLNRVVKVGFVPCTIGTYPQADVPIGKAERPVRLRIIRREGRWRIVSDQAGAKGESARGAWIHNGINLHFAGVRMRFFTQASAGSAVDARTAQIEVVTAPVAGSGPRRRLGEPGSYRRRPVKPYVPRALESPPARARGSVPRVESALDGAQYLRRLDDLRERLHRAR